MLRASLPEPARTVWKLPFSAIESPESSIACCDPVSPRFTFRLFEFEAKLSVLLLLPAWITTPAPGLTRNELAELDPLPPIRVSPEVGNECGVARGFPQAGCLPHRPGGPNCPFLQSVCRFHLHPASSDAAVPRATSTIARAVARWHRSRRCRGAKANTSEAVEVLRLLPVINVVPWPSNLEGEWLGKVV